MFSDIVKKKRKKLGYSREKLAGILGVSFVTVWRWERGTHEPKPDAIDYWVKRIKNL